MHRELFEALDCNMEFLAPIFDLRGWVRFRLEDSPTNRHRVRDWGDSYLQSLNNQL
jgi:hypothetical protein